MITTRISEAGLVYEFPAVDQNVYDEIMGDQVYSVHKNVLAHTNRCFRVIDIGAHAGLATLYFWLTWQDSGLPGAFRADCYEPQPDLFSLCRKNGLIATNGISAINKAVTKERCPVQIARSAEHPCCAQILAVEPDTLVDIPISASAADTIAYAPAQDVDILKIDTEGWEVGILEGYRDAKALDRFRCIMVEYHSEQDRRAIDAMITGHTLYDCRVQHSDGVKQGVAKYVRNDLA